jgi:hypothetical protein
VVRLAGADAHSRGRADVALERRFLLFAATVLVFHIAPALVGNSADEWIDLFTPFAVLATAAWLLAALRPPRWVVLLAGVAAVLYVDGHGIHLAANDIRNTDPVGEAETVAHFWDEEFGHVEWHLGWFGLLAAVALAPPAAARNVRALAAGAFLLGATMFTNTVEGGDWWLTLAGAVVFVPWALRTRRPLVVACAGAFAFAATLIAVWAIWHGGVPEFSDLGWL